MNKLKLKTFVGALVLGFAMSANPGPVRAGGTGNDQTIIYVCSSGKEIQVRYKNTDHKSTAVLILEGSSTPLKQVRAASGAKYSDGEMTWWEKGGTGLVQKNDSTILRDCKSKK